VEVDDGLVYTRTAPAAPCPPLVSKFAPTANVSPSLDNAHEDPKYPLVETLPTTSAGADHDVEVDDGLVYTRTQPAVLCPPLVS
jgi:hypothetical protein